MIMDQALHSRDNRDRLQEKKVEEDLLALNIAWMHQHKNLKIKLKKTKKTNSSGQ